MILADYHLHSNHSSDSTAPMESMILQGIKQGLTQMCFTEHCDLDYPENEDDFDFLVNLNSYKNEFLYLKDKYYNQIQLNYGLELGLTYDNISDAKAYIQDETFDFIIASTHVVHNIDPYEKIYFEKYPNEKGMEEYFKSILFNIKHYDNYCVYGHLDYAVRYCKDPRFIYHPSDYTDLIDEILKIIIENGHGIEVNTAGLKYGLGFPHPHTDILKRYLELGGEIITIGSDGHKPEHLAYDFDKIPELLKEIGFKYYTVFEQMKPYFLKI